MAKSVTAKPKTTKLISAVKPKAPAAKPSRKTKSVTEETPALSKKAEGKRKSIVSALLDEDEVPRKKVKKALDPISSEDQEVEESMARVAKESKGKKDSEKKVAEPKKKDKKESKRTKVLVDEAEEAEDADTEEEAPKSTQNSNKLPGKSSKSSAKTKHAKKAPTVPESDEDDEALSDADKENDSDEEQQETHIFGFSTDDDSSDDEMNGEPDPIEVGKLPTIAKDDATVKLKLEKAKKKPVCLVGPRVFLFYNVSPDCGSWRYIPWASTARFL
jgi:nucleolar protein 15